jgi:predicted transglutaminase-like cysteine proteinase
MPISACPAPRISSQNMRGRLKWSAFRASRLRIAQECCRSIIKRFMARGFPSICLAMIISVPAGSADAHGRPPQDLNSLTLIVNAAPTLAPFQHVRFCLRYPSNCKSDSTESDRIGLNAKTWELLNRVNHSVNMSIIPISKSYGPNLGDGWTIAPEMGDCNDYAVTKRHQLLENGLPSSALRLSVVKTASGIGHLVLVVATTKGDLVMDDLTEMIRPWQTTNYHWLKIQSATEPKFWYEISRPAIGPSVSQPNRRAGLADRSPARPNPPKTQ